MPKRNSKDDDDEDGDRPRPKRKQSSGRRPKKRGMPVGLIVGLAIGGVLLLGGVVVAIVMLTRGKPVQAAAPPDPFPNMLAYWSFDDIRVNADETITINDGTGRKNHGKMVGGKLAPGRKGNALWLDGREDTYVDVSTAKDLSFAPQAELTIAAWFLAREKYSGTIVAFHGPTTPTQLDIFVRDNRVIGIIGDDQDTGQHGFVWAEKNPNPTASNGQWHHVAMTRKEKFVEVFYDGISQGVDARGNSGGKLSGGMGAIGCHLGFVRDNIKNFGRAGYNGAIDEVYVFSRALKQNEVQALMNR
jgi:Concanavalin A-like lectin/glucanases superfamily